VAATPNAPSAATGRQRADGSRPVGNSSSVNTKIRPSTGCHHHWNQAASAAPGNDPGRVTSANSAYSKASTPAEASRPMAVKIQPSGLPGRWATITAPTTMKAVKASTRARFWPGSRWKLPLAMDRGAAA
jgi:hypothetical protein